MEGNLEKHNCVLFFSRVDHHEVTLSAKVNRAIVNDRIRFGSFDGIHHCLAAFLFKITDLFELEILQQWSLVNSNPTFEENLESICDACFSLNAILKLIPLGIDPVQELIGLLSVNGTDHSPLNYIENTQFLLERSRHEDRAHLLKAVESLVLYGEDLSSAIFRAIDSIVVIDHQLMLATLLMDRESDRRLLLCTP